MSGAKTLVMKFGGTSVGTPEAFRQVASIIASNRDEWSRIVVVTSAMAGVTNLLLEGAVQAVNSKTESIYQIAQRLRTAHQEVLEALLAADLARQAQVRQEINYLVGEFVNLCQAIAVLGEATPRALDAVAGLGERMSVRLLAAILEVQGVPAQFIEATQLIITDRNYQSAHPDLERTRSASRNILEPILAQGKVPVVTGFIASTPEGVTTTLGRGGSDYTAAVLGAVLPADDVWLWTDVDGVMSADPRVVPGARTIPVLSYREIAEMAYFGAKVVHPKTIRPVIDAQIGLRVCNTFNPDHPGTRVVADNRVDLGTNHADTASSIKAVTAIHDLSLVTVEGRGMLGVPGVAARTFGAVAATGTSVPMITQASSEQSICFAVPIEATSRVISSLEAAFVMELERKDIDRIWATEKVTIITVVGAGMRNTPGIAGRIFSILGANSVNVIAIAQGSSEVAISLVVDAPDADTGLRAVHDLIVDRLDRP